jgi:hypothetical protein
MRLKCVFPVGNLLFANSSQNDDLGNWKNQIISISSLSRNIGEDKLYEVSGIAIELDDSDRFFRDMMSGEHRYIAGKTVEIYSDDNLLLYTGSVQKWSFGLDAFKISINDQLSGLSTLIPGTISKNQYPSAVGPAAGESIPIIYGTLNIEGGAVKCWRIDTGKFLAARHHCFDLLDAQAYHEDGTTSPATLENHQDGNAYILCSSTNDFIYVNVSGKMAQDSSLIVDPIEALKDLINNYSSINYNSGSMAVAQSIMNRRDYKIAGLIGSQKKLLNVLVEFCFSFDCDFYLSNGNEIVISILDWSTLAPVKTIIESQVIDFRIDESPDEIRNKVKYMYRYHFGKDYFTRLPIFENPASIQNWGEYYNRNEPLDLRLVVESDVAFDVVQRFVIQHKNPKRTAFFEMPLDVFVGLELGDVIEIQHPAAIDIQKRKYQIRRFSVDFSMNFVQVEAVDITTLTGGLFVLGDRDTLPSYWNQAGETDRSKGYLADSETGYFSNTKDYGKVLY